MPDTTTQAQYIAQARAAAQKYGVPESVYVNMLAQESGFNPNAVNAKSGARGIAQFMPDTAKGLGIDPMDPNQAIDAGAKYLKQQIDYFHGDTIKGVAAYNFGAGNVDKAIAGAKLSGKNNWLDVLPEETKTYLTAAFNNKPPAAATGSTAPGATPEPKPDDFPILDPTTGKPAGTDWGAYYKAYSDYQQVSHYDADRSMAMQDRTDKQDQQKRGDLASYLDDVIKGIGTDIEAGNFNVTKAKGEFDRRMKAFDSGTSALDNLLGYAIPVGAQYVPGREPGGFYSKMGLDPVKGSGQNFDPFQEALSIVNQTPNLTTIPTPTTTQDMVRSTYQGAGYAPPGAPPPPPMPAPPQQPALASTSYPVSPEVLSGNWDALKDRPIY